MNDIYKITPKNPYHISVGCVLVDRDDKIVCHKH